MQLHTTANPPTTAVFNILTGDYIMSTIRPIPTTCRNNARRTASRACLCSNTECPRIPCSKALLKHCDENVPAPLPPMMDRMREYIALRHQFHCLLRSYHCLTNYGNFFHFLSLSATDFITATGPSQSQPLFQPTLDIRLGHHVLVATTVVAHCFRFSLHDILFSKGTCTSLLKTGYRQRLLQHLRGYLASLKERCLLAF